MKSKQTAHERANEAIAAACKRQIREQIGEVIGTTSGLTARLGQLVLGHRNYGDSRASDSLENCLEVLNTDTKRLVELLKNNGQ